MDDTTIPGKHKKQTHIHTHTPENEHHWPKITHLQKENHLPNHQGAPVLALAALLVCLICFISTGCNFWAQQHRQAVWSHFCINLFEAASKALQLAILCIKLFLCPICKLQIPIHNHDMIPWNHADMRGTNFDLRLGEGMHLKCEGVRPRMFVLICSYKSKSAVFLLHRYHVCLQTYMSKIPENDNESKINTHTHTTTKYPKHPYLLYKSWSSPKNSVVLHFLPTKNPPFRISVCCQRQGRLP